MTSTDAGMQISRSDKRGANVLVSSRRICEPDSNVRTAIDRLREKEFFDKAVTEAGTSNDLALGGITRRFGFAID
jgi:hypothetical protein